MPKSPNRLPSEFRHRSHYLARNVLTIFLMLAFTLTLSSKAECGAGDNAELYEYAAKFHGETCTGLIIGVRLGLAARSSLKLKVGEKAKARCFNHSCAVDGIQIAAGTTYGKRDLEVENRQENRLILTSARTGRQVEARLTRQAEEKTKYSLKLKKKIKTLPKDSTERQHLEKEAAGILNWFRTSAENVVVEINT